MGPGRLSRRADGNWILDFRDAEGRRKRKVLGGDKRVAERRRFELIRRRDMQLDGLGALEGQELRLDEIVPEYLEDLGPRVTAHHLRNVRGKIKKVMEEWGSKRVRDLKPMDAIRYRNRLVQDGLANRTANLYLAVVQAMLAWAVENKLIAESPLSRVKALPYTRDHYRYRRRAMTEGEIDRFLAASQEDDQRNAVRARLENYRRIPQTPLWMALLETGARWNELRTLTWGDFDPREKLIVLRPEITKTRRQREVPLREDMVERLTDLRVFHQSVLGRLPNRSDRVFLSPEGMPWRRPTTNPGLIFARVLVDAGIPKIDSKGEKLDLHALRTTCASRMLRNGAPLVVAQRILGHSTPVLTAANYTSLDISDLREGVRGLPSLGGVVRKSDAK